jgi:hypothetical protein
MAKLTLESFEDKEVRRVFVAANLREAQRTEELLMSEGIDYAVEPEVFSKVRLGIWQSQAVGAVFYVLAGQVAYCRKLLEESGLGSGVVSDELL